jgi:antitoxin (DNA-binding transcriptional repressor) of toxin-antitoxin stability system
MKTISMLEFRRDSDRVIRSARAGERMLLTYRGKPLFRLEPCLPEKPAGEDPFYRLADHADPVAKPLSNREIDEVVYGR